MVSHHSSTSVLKMKLGNAVVMSLRVTKERNVGSMESQETEK